jgi:hypothetical protein
METHLMWMPDRATPFREAPDASTAGIARPGSVFTLSKSGSDSLRLDHGTEGLGPSHAEMGTIVHLVNVAARRREGSSVRVSVLTWRQAWPVT